MLGAGKENREAKIALDSLKLILNELQISRDPLK
jgi:hypothetical protein